MSDYTQFGKTPSVTVRVTKADVLNKEPVISLNWSFGEVSIDEALAFLNHFRRALKFAMKEQRKIYRQRSDVELRKNLTP